MKVIINHSSMQPIYEQIVVQVKMLIANGELVGGAPLPSVRTLAKELQISALTVKKAYDALEEAGFVLTVHGKGSFIADVGETMLAESRRKEAEDCMELAIQKAKACGMTKEEIYEMLDLLLEQ